MLQARDIKAAVQLCPDLRQALSACVQGDADHVFVCAAHPDAANMVSSAQYKHGILLSEAFIAESQPLAILASVKSTRQHSIAVHPATRDYTDLSTYQEVHEVGSTVEAFEGLEQGRWDCALTAARFARESGIQLIAKIDPPRDAWLLLSRQTHSAVLSL